MKRSDSLAEILGVRRASFSSESSTYCTTLNFKPERLGLVYRGNVIEKVPSGTQAEKNGVIAGWGIMAINGVYQPNDSLTIHQHLMDAKKLNKIIKIKFRKTKKRKKIKQGLLHVSTRTAQCGPCGPREQECYFEIQMGVLLHHKSKTPQLNPVKISVEKAEIQKEDDGARFSVITEGDGQKKVFFFRTSDPNAREGWIEAFRKASKIKKNISLYPEGTVIEILRTSGRWDMGEVVDVDYTAKCYIIEFGQHEKMVPFGHASTLLRIPNDEHINEAIDIEKNDLPLDHRDFFLHRAEMRFKEKKYPESIYWFFQHSKRNPEMEISIESKRARILAGSRWIQFPHYLEDNWDLEIITNVTSWFRARILWKQRKIEASPKLDDITKILPYDGNSKIIELQSKTRRIRGQRLSYEKVTESPLPALPPLSSLPSLTTPQISASSALPTTPLSTSFSVISKTKILEDEFKSQIRHITVCFICGDNHFSYQCQGVNLKVHLHKPAYNARQYVIIKFDGKHTKIASFGHGDYDLKWYKVMSLDTKNHYTLFTTKDNGKTFDKVKDNGKGKKNAKHDRFDVTTHFREMERIILKKQKQRKRENIATIPSVNRVQSGMKRQKAKNQQQRQGWWWFCVRMCEGRKKTSEFQESSISSYSESN